MKFNEIPNVHLLTSLIDLAYSSRSLPLSLPLSLSLSLYRGKTHPVIRSHFTVVSASVSRPLKQRNQDIRQNGVSE